jgi:hypothetical protein
VPNAYNGVSGSLLLVENVVVQMIAEGGYYIASTDCDYFTYVNDRTYDGASLEVGDVISLVGQMYVYYGLDEIIVTAVRRDRESKQLALALSLTLKRKPFWHRTHAHPRRRPHTL